MKNLLLYFFALTALYACSNSETGGVDEAPPMPSTATHTLTEVFSVSQFDEDMFVSSIQKIAFLSNGHMILHQWNTPYLLEIDATGKLVGQIGREGRGPGEFLAIDRVVVTPGDTLHVFDRRNARQQLFYKDNDGSWIVKRSREVKREYGNEFLVDYPQNVYPGDPSKSQYITLFPNHIGLKDTTSKIYNFVTETDYNLNQTGDIKQLRIVQDAAVYRTERGTSVAYRSQYMRGFYLYHAEEQEIIYITNISNKIHSLGLSGSEKILGELPRQHLPLDDDVVESDLQRRKNSYEPERLDIIRSTYLDHEPYYRNIFLDEDRLWVHFTRQDSTAPDWATTTLSGEIQKSFKGMDNFNPLAVREGRVYGMSTDDDVSRLVAYELSEL